MTQKAKPNILFVFSDQHRWCDLGSYGNRHVLSPYLDALAEEGIRFENCISNSPVCVPARGTILTGQYPLKHGAVANDLPMQYGVASIADALAAAGYHTGYIGKWHLAGVPRDQFITEGPGRFGFKEWKVCNCNHNYLQSYYYDESNNHVGINGYEPIVQTDLAVDFIRRGQENDKPWFLTLSWGPPHDPYQDVPQCFLDLYEHKDIPLRDNVPEKVKVTVDQFITRQNVAENYKGYYAQISALDEQFGRMKDALKQTGQLENTIIIYTSDHGDMLGSQGLANKQLPYEESIKVPLIVSWKGHIPTAVTNEMISLVDLTPSILGLAGVKPVKETDGTDYHECFLNPEAKGRDACYIFDYIPSHQAMARGSREWRGIRTAHYTFARTASDEGYLLYDNIRDSSQMNNLIEDSAYEPIKAQLLAQLNAFIREHDRMLPWEDFIRHYGLKEQWNCSQQHFKLPLLE